MPAKINILIIEDNVIIADDLQQSLEAYGYNVVGNVISYEKAIETLSNSIVDLALIDINLSSKKNGIDVANYINLNNKIPFIYLTSYIDNETINKVTKTKPHAYLVKPFDKNTIHASIELAISKHINTNYKKGSLDYLYLKKNNLYHKVFIDSINFIKADNVYIEIYCNGDLKFLLRSTLKDFHSKLPNNFKRCNKSYIINLNSVESFNLNYIHIGSKKITVSKDFKPYIKSLIS